MEQAMQELTNTAVTFAIYGVLFMAALSIIKIALSRLSKRKKAGSNRRKEGNNFSEELMSRGDAYISRTHLMTPTEREVFKLLEKAYGEKYYIFCQVRVVDVIQPNTKKYHSKSKEYISLFRQLSQWHFDYVLCEKEGFKVFCALELDDETHNRRDRVKRDRMLNKACLVSKVNLKRLNIDHAGRAVKVVYSTF